MGTARIKRNAQETNVIVFTQESGKSDDEADGQSPHSENIKVDDDDDDFERPDFSDSSADSFFSRDSNYILEEYQLYTELEPIEEVKDASPAERSPNHTAQKEISEHGFDTYKLTNPKILPKIVKVDLISHDPKEDQDLAPEPVSSSPEHQV